MMLNLTPDELLSTTRAVRRRLDLNRPVERDVLDGCIQLALQAPSGGDEQGWHFVVVDDEAQKSALAELYRRAKRENDPPTVPADKQAMMQASGYLAAHLHQVPVLVIPCIEGRVEDAPYLAQAVQWASIIPAVWSFMLAARSRGLGTSWTSLHLAYEREAAEVLRIPYDDVMQVALIPVAYTVGTDFKPARRRALDDVVHWNTW
jgi:nitroreductase